VTSTSPDPEHSIAFPGNRLDLYRDGIIPMHSIKKNLLNLQGFQKITIIDTGLMADFLSGQISKKLLKL
jgi:hypothetical protein